MEVTPAVSAHRVAVRAGGPGRCARSGGQRGSARAASGPDGRGHGLRVKGRGPLKSGGAASRAEALPRVAHAEPLSGGGGGAWLTLMSGETCTGGTILSVTLAPGSTIRTGEDAARP